MDANTWLRVAKAPVYRYFGSSETKVFSQGELLQIFEANRAGWRLSTVGPTLFLTFLSDQTKFRRLTIPLARRQVVRYVWGDVPLLQVLMACAPNAYFSHQTALQLHQLTSHASGTIYLNQEQGATSQGGHLTQPRIDAAFQRKPRMSSNMSTLEGRTVCMLNGMNTGGLGVIVDSVAYEANPPTPVRVTDIERTLIDIVVRPAYSGGPADVLQAYALAKDRTSVAKIVKMLRAMSYVYPYHQSIGYCLERAGHPSRSLAPLRKLPMEFDFYLAHKMEKTRYVKGWRLHVPEALH